MKQRKEKSVIREYAEAIIFAVILAVVMRQFVVQAFKIPTGSMEQTLLVGDHILVNKFLYRFTPPKRFDIIVFKFPWDDSRDFIKRVVALPGERVEVRNRRVYVNGKPLHEPYAYYEPRGRETDFGPIIVPKKGDVAEIRNRQLYLDGQRVALPSGLLSGHFSPRNGSRLSAFEVFYGNGKVFPAGTKLDNAGRTVVAHDYYFTLGDNRNNSQDSRYWGFVEDSRIKGKAFFIYWSWDDYGRFAQHIRWNRLGQLLQLTTPAGRFANHP